MLFALLSVVVPCFFVGASLLAIDKRALQRAHANGAEADTARSGGVTAGVIVAAGYALGHTLLIGWSKFPPFESQNWIPWMALLAALLAKVFSATHTMPSTRKNEKPKAEVVRFVAAIAFALALSLVLLQAMMLNAWTRTESLQHVGILAACWFFLWFMLDRFRQEVRSSEFAAVAGGTMALMAPLLIFSASAVLGQLAGIAAVVFTPVFLLALRKRSSLAVDVMPPLLATIWIGLLASGYFYSELPLNAAGLALIAPLPARWTAVLLRRNNAVLRMTGILAAALLPLAIALFSAWSHYEPDPYSKYEPQHVEQGRQAKT